MIKIFCGKKATPERLSVLCMEEVQLLRDENDFAKSHLIFYPSQQEKHQAHKLGIPFYSPKDSAIRHVRLYLKQILRERLDDLLTLSIPPPPWWIKL